MSTLRHIYTHCCHPEIAKYPLHLATYNGRLKKIESILSSADHCLYQIACDDSYGPTNSCLFIAIARRQTTIAHVYLRIISNDFDAIKQHFIEISPKHRHSSFWLRQRILIAFGEDDIDFVRRTVAMADLLADPAKMDDRCGMIILLKPNNRTVAGVLWLTTRQTGADRKIAEIVDRIYQRGGELTSNRTTFRGYSLYAAAASTDQFSVWHSMHAIFGLFVEQRELARCFRLFAEHAEIQKPEIIVKKFNNLCEEFGNFTVESVLSTDVGIYILQDAINDYVNDHTILEYLFSVVAKTKHLRSVLNECVPDRNSYRSLISCSFELQDKKLPWIMLQYKPDLISKCTEWCDTPVNRFIKLRPLDQRVHDLIIEQLPAIGHSDEFKWKLLKRLTLSNWMETIRKIYEHDPVYKNVMFDDRKRGINLMKICAKTNAIDALAFLVVEHALNEEERYAIAISLLGKRFNYTFSETLWNVLGIEDMVKSDAGRNLLFESLKYRHLDMYQHLMQHIGNVNIKDIYNSKSEHLLFAAIWDKTATKCPPHLEFVDTHAPEFIDSDDDDESTAEKCRQNIERTPLEISSKPILDDDPVLEKRYSQLFNDLLQIGLDVHHQNAAGQNLVHIAVERNNLAIMRILNEQKLNTSHIDANGNRPMHLVNSVEMFQCLETEDVRCVNHNQETPMLRYLSRPEHTEELLCLFIRCGSDIHQANSDGGQALHLVRHPMITKMLLDGGANVNARNLLGDTPALCVFESDRNLSVIRLLFEHPDHDFFACNKKGISFVTHLVSTSEEDFKQLRTAIGEETLKNMFTMHCNCCTKQGYCLLAFNQQDDENLFSMQTLLEISEFKVKPQIDLYPFCAFDVGRWLIQCGAHISQRRDERLLDWKLCSSPGDFLAQMSVFIAAGLNTELENVAGETALQCYSGFDANFNRDLTQILARLLVAGANYRRCSRYDGKPVLVDSVFASFYEWDDEKPNEKGMLHQVFQDV